MSQLALSRSVGGLCLVPGAHTGTSEGDDHACYQSVEACSSRVSSGRAGSSDASSSGRSASRATLPEADFTPPSCRLCWGEEEAGSEGKLVSPCSCSGTMRFIHVHCLHEWQHTLHAQGQARRAMRCELCKSPYVTSPGQPPFQYNPPSVPTQLAAHTRGLLRAASDVRCWPSALSRLWTAYALASGLVSAVHVGAGGLVQGVGLAYQMVQPQARLVAGGVEQASRLLGWPIAHLLCQRALSSCLGIMLLQLVYLSAGGMLGGAVCGFCAGYLGALCSSVRLAGRGALLLRGGVRGAWAVLRRHASPRRLLLLLR